MNQTTETGRATSIAEMRERMGRMFVRVSGVEPYRPRPTDVIITPFGKCGTTWLQQIFHTLRTRGDLDFDDVSRVVPWIETAPRLGIDINAEQKAQPRGFKSHMAWDQVPKGARYIVSVRDPRDALVSAFKFMEGWFLEPDAVPIDEFARERHLQGRGYWQHLASWWPQRDRDDVLLLAYEHMIADPERAIRRIAAFCEIPLDDALLAVTLEHSSLPFMLQHKDKFDDLLMRQLSERLAGIPPGGDSAKVRAGQVGSHKTLLGAEVVADMDAIWAEEIAGRFGLESYAELIEALN